MDHLQRGLGLRIKGSGGLGLGFRRFKGSRVEGLGGS